MLVTKEGKPVKILIVDDNEDLAETIRDYYDGRELGVIPLTTCDPNKVLSILDENRDIRLILSDFYMPGMSGLELLLTVREKYPHVFFVLMTGYHSDEIQAAGLEYGAVRFFQKPFDVSELTKLIHETIPDTPTGFDGTIDSIQLPDIIQLIGLSRRTVEVSLTVGKSNGSIFFENGEIIHAVNDDQEGEEAFHEMFKWVGGKFNVKPLTSDVERTINRPWQGLVLEAARRQDEAQVADEGELIVKPDHETEFKPETAPQEVIDKPSTEQDDKTDQAVSDIVDAERDEQIVLDDELISSAIEKAVNHYLQFWQDGEEKVPTSSLPLDSLPDNIRYHIQFRFQQYLLQVIRMDGVPFDFDNEKVAAAVQDLLSTLYSTWDVPRTTYEELLRYAISFELARSIDPARAITEVIHEISHGIASKIVPLVRGMIDYKLIGEHFLTLLADISKQDNREISARAIEYLCRSAIYRLDEEQRSRYVRDAMRCIIDIAALSDDLRTDFLHFNVVMNMLEAHGLAQVADYINMTRELSQVSMSVSDLDHAMEKFKERSRGVTAE